MFWLAMVAYFRVISPGTQPKLKSIFDPTQRLHLDDFPNISAAGQRISFRTSVSFELHFFQDNELVKE